MRLLMMLAILVAALPLSAGGQWQRRWVLSDSLPSYLRITASEDIPGHRLLPDSVFNSQSGHVIFKVNSTQLNLDDPLLKELTNDVLPLCNARELMLFGLELRGAASPEGPLKRNEYLSRTRAHVLRTYLQQRLDSIQLKEELTRIIPEDNQYLVWLMEQSGDADAQLVKEIVEQCGADNSQAIKQRLKGVRGGALWRRLLKEYFPRLRAARMVLYFRYITPPGLDAIVTSPGQLPLVTLDRPSELAVVDMFGFHVAEPKTELRHLLSVSTNLLYDLFYMPDYGFAPMLNIGVEYFPKGGNFTFRAAFTSPYYHKWNRQRFFQIRDYHLEVRRYFNPGMLHTGFYLGAYANASKYGIGLGKTRGWQGEGIGGALKAGYVLPLASGRWRMDFHIAGGTWMTRYDRYVYGNPITGQEDGWYYYDWTHGPDKFKRRNNTLWWFGPTEVGITLSYDILYRSKRPRRATFHRWE